MGSITKWIVEKLYFHYHPEKSKHIITVQIPTRSWLNTEEHLLIANHREQDVLIDIYEFVTIPTEKEEQHDKQELPRTE